MYVMAPLVAGRESWKTLPLPERREPLQFDKLLSAADYQVIARGFIPQQMEDKWFVFLESDWLYVHRSWTGVCIYTLRLEAIGDGFRVAEAWVNRDTKQYAYLWPISRHTPEQFDVLALEWIIDCLLLGKDVEPPVQGESVQHCMGLRRN
jgi:hypothetical protein